VHDMRIRSVKVALIVGATLVAGCSGSSNERGSSSPTAPSSSSSSNQVNVQGTVGALRGSCPDLSFELGSERILTNGTTQFQRAGCSALNDRTVVEVEGIRQPDLRILAREVKLEEAAAPPPAPPAPAPGAPTEVEGLISGLAGACPNLTFNIGSTRIRTNGTTEFNRIPCSFLTNGMDVEVEGSLQSDGALLAREVQPDELTLTGSIGASLSGACPDRSFTVDGQRVLTLVTTRFDDITCAALQAQMRVEVRGVRRPDGLLLATRVRPLENRGPNEEVRVTGRISGLSGTCPNRSFTVANDVVMAHAGTRFDDVTCGGLVAGTQVEARGFRQSNGSILADRIKREN